MRMRRGQAAFEFLTTYGWAFLVVLVMIGALAYFGVLDPAQFIPEKCVFQQELGCSDYQLIYDSATRVDVNLYVTNNLGESITLTEITIGSYGSGSMDTCSGVGGAGVSISPSQSVNLACPNIDGVGFTQDRKSRLQLTGTYSKASGVYPHQITGEIYATVQPPP